MCNPRVLILVKRRRSNSVDLLPESASELERIRLALNIDGALVYEWSLIDDTITWNNDVTSVLGDCDPEQLKTGAGFHAFLDPEGAALRTSLANNPSPDFSAFQIEYQYCSESGEVYWLQDRGRRLMGPDGKPSSIIGVLRAITDWKIREVRLNYLASYDELTGQLNRARLRERLDQAIASAERSGRPGAYFVAAIDELADLNADYGFDVADEVIAGIGHRLERLLEDSQEIGRIAGNKFGIIVNDCADDDLVATAQKFINAAQEQALETSAGAISVSISVGCVAYPTFASNSQEAMFRAVEALDKAKATGRSSFSVFSMSEQVQSIRRRNALVADQIISALNDRRICVAYQPIVAADTLETEKYECLVRMIEPCGDIVLAGDFVPMAEQLGLVRLIDRRVLELVTEALHAHPGVKLAVNVSGITATEPDSVEGYLAHIEANRDVADRLTIELTETSAIRDMEESAKFLSRLRDLGCRVAIDDFGAGYTSFRNLQALVVDSVKIDGAFIRGLAQSRDNQLFVRTLVDLAKYFNLETVAEWVSNSEEAQMLCDYGVDYLQGYYVGQPSMTLMEPAAALPVTSGKTA